MKKFFISFLILISVCGLCFLGWYKVTPKVSVLMYHDIFNENEIPESKLDQKGNITDDCIITTENFKKQMDFLKENNYHTLSLDEFYNFVVNGTNIPPKSILITFDDGRKSNIINAYPILKENHQHAVIFLVTSKISPKNIPYNPKKYQRISFDEINNSKDVFEFAAHTHNMHERDKKTKKAYLLVKSDDEIKKDLTENFKHSDKPFFAYPYGSHRKRHFKLLKDCGFKMAFTTRKGKIFKGENPYKINRYGIKNEYSLQKFKHIVEN